MSARSSWLVALLLATPAFAQITTSDLPVGEEISTSSAAANGAWTQLQPFVGPSQTPSGRMLHTAIYDPNRQRLLAFGGLQYSSAFHELWAASLQGNWTALSPAGTPPGDRRDHVAVYDSQRKRMIVYGGSPANDGFDTDTWALALDGPLAWSEVPTTGTPTGRFSHAGIYDPLRDRLIVFGGYTANGFTNETYALAFATGQWSQVAAVGTVPSARDAMTAIYDPVRDRMLVFGGWTGSVFDNRVWALSLSGTPTWSEVATLGTPPSARRHYGAAYDATGDRLVILGGFDQSSQYKNDAWALTLSGTPAWEQLDPIGDKPSPRNGQRAIFDPVNNRVVQFGGYDGNYVSDLWTLSLDYPPAWSKLAPAFENGEPGPLRDHVAVYEADHLRMLVFGGSRYDDSFSSDVYALSLSGAPGWLHLNPTGRTPDARFSHAAIYHPLRREMIVFGGYSSGGFKNDVWALTFALGNPGWYQVLPTGTAPAGRDAMTAVYDPARDRMLVFGGFTGPNTFYNDVWELAFPTLEWHQLSPSGTPPSPRRHYAAAWDPAGDRLLVTGGFDAGGYRADTWALQFDAQGGARWIEQYPRGPTPSARNGHRAVLDAANNRLLVYGGYDGGYRNDLWELSLKGKMSWHSLKSSPHDPAPRPSLLGSFIADAANQRFIQFGGVDIGSALGDVWSFESGTGNNNAVLEPAPATNPSFGIRKVTSGNNIDVEFTLPDARPADLALYSVSGRLVAKVRVSGAGIHQAALSRGGRMGVYLVRLSNGVETWSEKVVLGLGR